MTPDASCDGAKSKKCLAFLSALAGLCAEHSVVLSTSGYDGLQVWDRDRRNPCEDLIQCAGIEDMTIPAPELFENKRG